MPYDFTPGQAPMPQDEVLETLKALDGFFSEPETWTQDGYVASIFVGSGRTEYCLHGGLAALGMPSTALGPDKHLEDTYQRVALQGLIKETSECAAMEWLGGFIGCYVDEEKRHAVVRLSGPSRVHKFNDEALGSFEDLKEFLAKAIEQRERELVENPELAVAA